MKLNYILVILLLINISSCELKRTNNNLSAEQLLIKGNDELEKDNYNVALEYFLKSKQKNSTLPKLDLMMGMTYFMVNSQDSSLKYLNTALQIDSLSVVPLYFRGQIFFDRQDFNRAIDDFEEYLNKTEDASIRFLIGKSYLNLLEPEIALQYFNKAISLNGNDYYWYQNRAIAYTLLEDYQSVINDCNNSLKLKSNDGSAYLTRAMAYFYLKDTLNACRDFRLAKELTDIVDDHVLNKICGD